MYADDNDGKFWLGWKTNKTWFCSTATKPIWDKNGIIAQILNIFNAWGIFWDAPLGQEAVRVSMAGLNKVIKDYLEMFFQRSTMWIYSIE